MSRGTGIGARIGAAIFGLGLLCLTFVAYQLWGTALYEEQAQAHLKSELAGQLHYPLPARLTASERLGLPPIARTTAASRPDPAVNRPVGLLSIPKIGLLDAIVEGVGEAQLEQGPGHYPGTALPGEAGNVGVAGHRTTYAHPFYNLNVLAPGDNIYILTAQGLFQYTVSGSQVVVPTDVAVLASSVGKSTLTLTTCNPRYSAAQRLVVTATFDGKTAPTTIATSTSRAGADSLAGESSSSALGGGSASWVPPVLWGLLTIGIVVAAYILWRVAGRRVLRIVIVVSAVPLFLLALLVCFEHISLALPGSF